VVWVGIGIPMLCINKINFKGNWPHYKRTCRCVTYIQKCSRTIIVITIIFLQSRLQRAREQIDKKKITLHCIVYSVFYILCDLGYSVNPERTQPSSRKYSEKSILMYVLFDNFVSTRRIPPYNNKNVRRNIAQYGSFSVLRYYVWPPPPCHLHHHSTPITRPSCVLCV